MSWLSIDPDTFCQNPELHNTETRRIFCCGIGPSDAGINALLTSKAVVRCAVPPLRKLQLARLPFPQEHIQAVMMLF